MAAAYIQHAIPGRMRLKVPSRRGDEGYFADVARKLSKVREVRRSEVNAATASVLIEYDPGAAEDTGRLLEIGRQLGLDEVIAGAPPVLEDLQHRSAGVRREVGSFLGSTGLDLNASVFLVLLGLSVIQVMRGQILAPAVTLAWYAGTALLIRASQQQA